MTLIATTYCTAAEIKRRCGDVAWLNYTDHDADGIEDSNVGDDAINEATETISFYCQTRGYSVASLAASTLINRWTVVVAWYVLARNRGNPPPDSLAIEYAEIIRKLEAIAAGKMSLPGVAFSSRPGMSNHIIDRRYPQSKVRVEQHISTDQPSTLPRNFKHEFPTINP